MKQHTLGTNGPLVSAQGLGCMGMSISYGEPNDEESIATLHRALELGVNLIVTSDAYGAGVNEELVGRALKGRRSSALIATKFGNLRLAGVQHARFDRRPSRLRTPGVQRFSPAPRRRRDRHLWPASCRSDGPDRGDRRCDEASRRAGKGALSRLIGGGAPDDTPRTSGASDRCGRNRIFALEP